MLLYRATGSPAAPALYILVRNAPRVLGTLPGGTLADRAGPVSVAATCALAQAALTAAIVMFGRLHLIAPIYLTVACSQFILGLSQPASSAIVPRLVSPRQLGQVNAYYNGLLASAILVAPAIGAVLLTRLPPETLIAVDAASFVVAGVLLLSLRHVDRRAEPGIEARSIRSGFRLVRRDPMLRALAAGYLGNAAVVTGLQAVLVVAAAERFGSDTSVGWLYAAVGAGSLVGSVWLIRRAPANIQRHTIVAATLLELAPLAGFTLVNQIALAVTLLFLSSLGAITYQTQGATGLQERAGSYVLGRAAAVIRFAQYLGMLVGGVIAVTLVQVVGWPGTVRLLAAGALALLVTALLWPTGPRSRRRR